MLMYSDEAGCLYKNKYLKRFENILLIIFILISYLFITIKECIQPFSYSVVVQGWLFI